MRQEDNAHSYTIIARVYHEHVVSSIWHYIF